MTRQINYEIRKARGGKGLIPPNKDQWDQEHNGLDLRLDLDLPLEARLEPLEAFALYDSVTVRPHGEIPAASVFIEHFRNSGSGSWSGMSLRLQDGHELVFYNDAHPATRVHATLMEEFFHLRLGHPRSELRIFGGESGENRSYNSSVEYEAYSSGAAALVPYKGLNAAITRGDTVSAIARLYGVSTALVSFRMKVTKLWRKQRKAHHR